MWNYIPEQVTRTWWKVVSRDGAKTYNVRTSSNGKPVHITNASTNRDILLDGQIGRDIERAIKARVNR